MQEKKIAELTGVAMWQVKNTLKLFSEGATIPFIARYRKEATGDLDEVKIQLIIEEFQRLEELEKRRAFILEQIESQGKMTPDLKRRIETALLLQELEDLYLPYKPRRKTKADVAREKGLEPLAALIYEQKSDRFLQVLGDFVKGDVPDKKEALQGARDIIAEWISEDAAVRSGVRHLFEKEAVISAKPARGKKDEPEAQKFRDYFQHTESLSRCPSHRFLAMKRGANLGFLKLSVEPDRDKVLHLLKRLVLRGYFESTEQVKIAMEDSYDRLLQSSMESEMLQVMTQKADDEAIGVFAANAKQLLLAPPLGEKRVLAIDPGFRTGCKIVGLDEKGDLILHDTVYPHEPVKDNAGAARKLAEIVKLYNIDSIAVGNGTAGRETEEFVRSAFGSDLNVYMVNEAGASIYSAGEVAREEFPSLDVTVRGAISIGRRLMDPLAELVKIDPRNIGVGQYQHDVNQTQLKKKLDTVVESAVNAVGVNLNTASKHLLSYVSGLGPVLAKNIVDYREKEGMFKSREELKKVARLGAKAFEQCAGFLRIRGAANPLDESAVHPERYAVVKKMAKQLNTDISGLTGNAALLERLNLNEFVDEAEGLGLPTLKDILNELKKPGLDPRGVFEQIGFSEAVRSINDLDSGLELNGVITNITDFGAFVDIGVKQDGLVHISQLSNKFIKHPLEVVSLGQHVKVRVMEVDAQRKRISLTMKF